MSETRTVHDPFHGKDVQISNRHNKRPRFGGVLITPRAACYRPTWRPLAGTSARCRSRAGTDQICPRDRDLSSAHA